ncbi:hypothetical protein MYP_3458 [Sporocytophaga myxococcoides]|uniref:Uncharacterized protein n=1 Tax=Sporocytophaga myxococcoides TaxID=153721 RepID=A0A098LIH0_9BACT|nr:hypothetical protein [Sporocytophaga myxococcoides]GAL86229.1 hypothetical protein MYP_3458 [Sporocytophaga myxococcoides]
METITPIFKLPLNKSEQGRRPVSVYTFFLILGVTCIMTGVLWDICWHMSIGRDSLFSPPHLAIYLGGLVTGIGSIIKLLMVTLSKKAEDRNSSVSFWGMKAPLGTLFCIWGAASMLTSAPFDDWWHNTYGLDVKILSPPHALLFAGIISILIGTMLTVLSFQNQRENINPINNDMLRWSFAYTASLFLTAMYIFIIEELGNTKMHNPLFYQLICSVLIMPLTATMRGSRLSYPATSITGLYTLILLIHLWIFPLFPAEPKLAPILNPIKHYVPLLFPLLLIIPGFILDKLYKRISTQNIFIQAAYCGSAFFVSLFVAQWFFSYFLNSPMSRNWIFQTHALPYYKDPNAPHRFEFIKYPGTTIQYYTGFMIALLYAIVFSYLGLKWGNWMRRVQR